MTSGLQLPVSFLRKSETYSTTVMDERQSKSTITLTWVKMSVFEAHGMPTWDVYLHCK